MAPATITPSRAKPTGSRGTSGRRAAASAAARTGGPASRPAPARPPRRPDRVAELGGTVADSGASDSPPTRSQSSMTPCTAEPSASAPARPAGAPGTAGAAPASSTCSRPLGLVAGAGSVAAREQRVALLRARRRALARSRHRRARRRSHRAGGSCGVGSTSRPPSSSYSSAIAPARATRLAMGPSSTPRRLARGLLVSLPKQRDHEQVAGAGERHVEQPPRLRSPAMLFSRSASAV